MGKQPNERELSRKVVEISFLDTGEDTKAITPELIERAQRENALMVEKVEFATPEGRIREAYQIVKWVDGKKLYWTGEEMT